MTTSTTRTKLGSKTDEKSSNENSRHRDFLFLSNTKPIHIRQTESKSSKQQARHKAKPPSIASTRRDQIRRNATNSSLAIQHQKENGGSQSNESTTCEESDMLGIRELFACRLEHVDVWSMCDLISKWMRMRKKSLLEEVKWLGFRLLGTHPQSLRPSWFLVKASLTSSSFRCSFSLICD
eukprot:TRINITY_DN1655_c0_g3_i4.p1 TRINITY_DN1655_c0_g3~~TRINITY_DN1655_c0_g3_i4.p1  ORF type:complete len:180 (-),score=16.62 TRINITY_DN1655_c0_g3_i4:30-569(-)